MSVLGRRNQQVNVELLGVGEFTDRFFEWLFSEDVKVIGVDMRIAPEVAAWLRGVAGGYEIFEYPGGWGFVKSRSFWVDESVV